MSKGIPLTDEDRWPWLYSLRKILRDEAESSALVYFRVYPTGRSSANRIQLLRDFLGAHG